MHEDSNCFHNSLRVCTPNPTRHADHRSHIAADAKHVATQQRSQRNQTSHSNNKPKTPGSRNAQTKAAIICYEYGNWKLRECPTWLNRKANSTNSGGKKRERTFETFTLFGRKVHTQKNKGVRKENHEPGKRERNVKDSSTFASTPLKTLSRNLRFPFYCSTAHPLYQRK